MKTCLRAVLALLLMAAVVVVRAPSGQAAISFTNPLAAAPYGADPWMGYGNGWYYLAATTWNSQIVIKRARSVAALPGATESVVHTGSGPTNCCNVWAPSLHKLTGPNGARWYLYYSAGTPACCDGQRSHVLESSGSDSTGPYAYKGRLDVQANNGWAIDGSVATIGGQNYFFYSSWVGDLQSLFVARLTNPWTSAAYGTRISYPTYDWEKQGGNTEEAPYVVQRNGVTYLTFSASSCNTPDYKLGLLTLTGSNPLAASSWTKKSTPIFQRSDANGVYGPGGQGFFTSPDGTETWLVHHANESTAQGCGGTRTTRIKKVSWNADGSYRITNVNSGKVLDSVNCGAANGTALDLWSSLGNVCQEWSVTPVDGRYLIANRGNGLVLDAESCGTADGVVVRQWGALGNACQQWSITA
uniref:family 43 glycosylhydrolase n=1 Tax=Paractinoplanes polyasparticus TaxID=2856853 RepID=UPI001C84A12B|nr:family 43 glycosylhydrolase [Actinoplanes polyasparticus]